MKTTTIKSVAFKRGYRYALEFKMHNRPIPMPFDPNTKEGRDFEAGVKHGQAYCRVNRV